MVKKEETKKHIITLYKELEALANIQGVDLYKMVCKRAKEASPIVHPEINLIEDIRFSKTSLGLVEEFKVAYRLDNTVAGVYEIEPKDFTAEHNDKLVVSFRGKTLEALEKYLKLHYYITKV